MTKKPEYMKRAEWQDAALARRIAFFETRVKYLASLVKDAQSPEEASYRQGAADELRAVLYDLKSVDNG
jgi:hypothetical protein